MSETAAATPSTPASKASKGKKPKAFVKASKPRAAPTHPPISEMVNKAIAELKERNGSSAQAIKKYIAKNYKVDVDRLAPFIKKYLKSGGGGSLTQTKGKGASGSFKLTKTDKKAAKPKVAVKKEVKPKSDKPKAKKSPAKKVVASKAKKSPKKKVSPKKEAKPKASKVEKKPKVSKAAKPKSPKKKVSAGRPKKTPVKKVSKK